MISERQPYTLDRVVRLLITVTVSAAAVWLIYRLRDVLLPFFVAALIAYLLEPFVQYNRRLLRLRGRVIATFVTLFEAIFLLGILCFFLIPMIAEEVDHVAALMRLYSATTVNIPFLPDSIHDHLRRFIDFESVSSLISQADVMKIVETSMSRAWSLLTGGITMIISVLSWFIVLLYVVFIMLDYDRLAASFRHMVPPAWRPLVYRIGNDIQRSMNHYFRGQALVALLVGILFSIGFLIIGMPLAIVLGMFIGLLNMVPYLQLISIIPTVFLCVVCSVDRQAAFWPIFWQCMAVYAIVQLIQDLILVPRIMGKAMGLNPAIILLSLSVWGSLLGFLGLIIALPLTTLLLAYYDEYIHTYHASSRSSNPPVDNHSDNSGNKI